MDRFETFATTIARLNRCISRLKSLEMEAVGLKSGHVMCLYALGKAPGGLTAGELQGVCGEDKAAVSRTLSELTQRGYVRGEASDRRHSYRARLFLTRQGQELVDYVNARVDAALEAVGQGLSEADREAFYGSLALIAENLERYVRERRL